MRNLSVRKTILLYMLGAVVLSILPSYLTANSARRLQTRIWERYMGEEYWQQVYELYEFDGHSEKVPPTLPPVTRPDSMVMSSRDLWLSELCDFLQTYSLLLFVWPGIIAAVFLFYKNKIRVPLAELTQAAAAIGSQNLDFTINYFSRDELGQVCTQFDIMRKQLADNNRRMWNMLEQERALRASIAHDIRSPLTILKGYQEMLLELVPDSRDRGKTEEDMAEMLLEGMAQIGRMEEFLGSMVQLSALEERQIRLREIRLSELAGCFRKNLEFLAADSGRKCGLHRAEGLPEQILRIDVEIVTEVLENLVANALRYACKRVTAALSVTDGELFVEVSDDGPGFSQNPETLTKPCYHANPQDDLTHFGMGLYICRVYCEKAGGRLLLQNTSQGGKATAIFPC